MVGSRRNPPHGGEAPNRGSRSAALGARDRCSGWRLRWLWPAMRSCTMRQCDLPERACCGSGMVTVIVGIPVPHLIRFRRPTSGSAPTAIACSPWLAISRRVPAGRGVAPVRPAQAPDRRFLLAIPWRLRSAWRASRRSGPESRKITKYKTRPLPKAAPTCSGWEPLSGERRGRPTGISLYLSFPARLTCSGQHAGQLIGGGPLCDIG
jgi:hypothetical protein